MSITPRVPLGVPAVIFELLTHGQLVGLGEPLSSTFDLLLHDAVHESLLEGVESEAKVLAL